MPHLRFCKWLCASCSFSVCAKKSPCVLHSPGSVNENQTQWLGPSRKQSQSINTVRQEHRREGCHLIGCWAQISTPFCETDTESQTASFKVTFFQYTWNMKSCFWSLGSSSAGTKEVLKCSLCWHWSTRWRCQSHTSRAVWQRGFCGVWRNSPKQTVTGYDLNYYELC